VVATNSQIFYREEREEMSLRRGLLHK